MACNPKPNTTHNYSKQQTHSFRPDSQKKAKIEQPKNYRIGIIMEREKIIIESK